MNARFERLEAKLEKKADQDKIDARFTALQVMFLAELTRVNERLTEETTWGGREIRSRLERCERDIEELKGRKGS
jgi:hypothetical protein